MKLLLTAVIFSMALFAPSSSAVAAESVVAAVGAASSTASASSAAAASGGWDRFERKLANACKTCKRQCQKVRRKSSEVS